MREIETVVVLSIESLLEEMVPRLGFQRTPVYRGQASSEWSLLPSLLREEVARTEHKSWAELESAFLLSLKQQAGDEIGYELTQSLRYHRPGFRLVQSISPERRTSGCERSMH